MGWRRVRGGEGGRGKFREGLSIPDAMFVLYKQVEKITYSILMGFSNALSESYVGSSSSLM